MAKKKVTPTIIEENIQDEPLEEIMGDRFAVYANIDFSINDCTPSEIQSESISKIKQVLSTKIGQANYMIAIIGEHSNDEHPDSEEIGYKNWQAYEIDKNNEKGNGLVVVRLDSSYSVPDEAYGIGAKWVYSFNLDDILEALEELKN